MATIFDRGGMLSRTSRNAPTLPTALIALMGNEAVIRGALRARDWLKDNLERGVTETRHSVKPLRKAASREMEKGEKLSNVVPFFPAIPLVPLAIVAGLTTFSAIMAVRLSRRDRKIMARLDAIEADLARLRQNREAAIESEADQTEPLGSQPAQLPWT